jgi:hypothetical protein
MAKDSEKRRDMRFSLSDLEGMRTHELAELMANFVLLLRRLPDVPFSDLVQLPEPEEKASNGDDLVNKAHNRVNGHGPGWWAEKGEL